jgi:hypothetical protein
MSAEMTLPRLPRSFELAELMDQLVGHWAFLGVDSVAQPVEGPAPLPMEYRALIRGRLGCILVLRSTRAFAEEIAYASTGDPGARAQGDDAFKELCNMLCSHLLTLFLGGETGSFAPFLPEPSEPGQWPERASDVSAVVMMGGQPVEIRLWEQQGAGRG